MDKEDKTSEQEKNKTIDERFILPTAECYGGFQKSWDFGPCGSILKKKIKELFYQFFVSYDPYNISYDGAILTPQEVWENSGHLQHFYDLSVNCLRCKKRQRLNEDNSSNFSCSRCSFTKCSEKYRFYQLLTTDFGNNRLAYLRPETCQGIFTNVHSIKRAIRRSLPFGVVQIGKSFRNETTLNHGIFRMREFEQMELEFFCSSEEANHWWSYWVFRSWTFLKKLLLNNPQKIRQVPLEEKELPHYSKQTIDFYFDYSFGWGELCSNSNRGDYDLKRHAISSLENGTHVIETSFGVERLFLAIMEDSLCFDDERFIRRFPPILAPYFLAVLAVYPKFHQEAYKVFLFLLAKLFPFEIVYEKSSSVGKGYYYQDSLGTYFCLTVDKQSLQDRTVTLRYRDSKKQERIAQENIESYLRAEYLKHYQNFFNG